jgi:hypothetical protein
MLDPMLKLKKKSFKQKSEEASNNRKKQQENIFSTQNDEDESLKLELNVEEKGKLATKIKQKKGSNIFFKF